jgi:hypothetical protein
MEAIPKIETARLDELFLDAKNLHLGRHNVERGLSQEEVLALMKDWSLEELAVSFLESGFWPQEALICIQEAVKKQKQRLIVVEGNRRLAALKMIHRTRMREEASPTCSSSVPAGTTGRTNGTRRTSNCGRS